MGGLLKATHKNIIKSLAMRAKKDKISLYEEGSLSGTSDTLRYRRDWIDTHGRWGLIPRYETGMVFSIKVYKGDVYRPEAHKKFNQMAREAKLLFKRLSRR